MTGKIKKVAFYVQHRNCNRLLYLQSSVGQYYDITVNRQYYDITVNRQY